MEKRLMFIWLFMSLTMVVRSQDLPLGIQSPNAAGISEFGKIPVSLFTGTPEINIPVFTIDEAFLSVPIFASYRASGVLADQHPGWIGANWTLHTGGAITRKVRGVPDEYIFYDHRKSPVKEYKIGYYYNLGNITSSINMIDYFNEQIRSGEDVLTEEVESDEFSFSLPGLSGTFYRNPWGEWSVKCNKYVTLKCLNDRQPVPSCILDVGARQPNSNAPSFYTFLMTTDDGVKYYFGGDDKSIEYSIDFYNQKKSEWIANAWYLTRIEHPGGMKIDYRYERDSFISQMYLNIKNRYRNSKDDVNVVPLGIGSLSFGYAEVCASSDASSTAIPYLHVGGAVISPVYLAQITSPSYTLEFKRSESKELKVKDVVYKTKLEDLLGGRGAAEHFVITQMPYVNAFLNGYYMGNPVFKSSPEYGFNGLAWRVLNKIIVKYKGGKTSDEIAKTIEFKIGGYGFNRSVLSGIIFPDQSYSFLYSGAYQEPDYFSNAIDHWGYYNGVKPADPVGQGSYERDRGIVDIDKMMSIPVLSKITYPTGAVAWLTYEPHEYNTELKEKRWEGCKTVPNTKTGGLRVKNITTYSSHAYSEILESKDYFYIRNYSPSHTTGQSSGVLGGKIKYNQEYSISAHGDPSKIAKVSAVSSVSLLPACMNTDSYIGYTEVIEKYKHGGYTKYTFSNFDNGYLDAEPAHIMSNMTDESLPYVPYTSNAYKRGNLLNKKDYNGSGVLIREKEIAYNPLGYGVDVSPCHFEFWKPCNSPLARFYTEGTIYKNNVYCMLPGIELETVYDINGNKTATTKKDFDYQRYNLIRKVTHSVNDKEYEYHTIYSGDMGSEYWSPSSMEMQKAGIMNKPVCTYTVCNGSVIDGSYIEYDSLALYYPRRIYSLKTKGVSSSDLKKTSFNIEPDKILTNDHNGAPQNSKYYRIPNIVEVKDNKSKLTTAYCWDFNHKLVAEIKNSTRAVVNALLPSYDVKDIHYNALRSKLPAAFVTTCEYLTPFGPSCIISPAGVATYYEYDALGRLKDVSVKEKNTTGTEVKKVIEGYEYLYYK